MDSNKQARHIFWLIIPVCLVVPFNNDLFISGLPAISQYFSGSNTSLVMSIALLGLACSQPFYGPLLDRYGRRPVLLVGLLIYTLASAQIMLTHSFNLLLIGRFLQAIGVCSAIISAFAIAKDIYKNEELIKATSLIMAMIAISPTIAPLVGAILNTLWGWRASFIFLFIIGCFFIVLIYIVLPETLRNKNLNAIAPKYIIANYFNLAKCPGFISYCLVSGFSYGILFSYFNLSTLFIIQQMHFGLISYGIIVAINALALMGMSVFVPRIMKIISLQHTMHLGLIVILIGGLMMAIINVHSILDLYTFILPMFVTTLGIGMIRPTASTGAMQLADNKVSGSASAFFNFVSFLGGTTATMLSAKFINQVTSFGLFIAIMATGGLLMISINAVKYRASTVI